MTEESRGKSLKIDDLVEVPDIRTVIQLEDLNDPDLRGMIADTFVITSEVLENLQSVLASLTGPEGRGIFLKGNFGSGKSHFLGMLSLLLRHSRSWDNVLSQAPSLEGFRQKILSRRFLVVERSLVRHRGSEFLEDILLSAVVEELGHDALREFEGLEDRHSVFSRLREVMREMGFSGLVILLDELSEFLRSKTDARAYNEDIRFLQYLGEEALSFPLWVIASLQEWIEETGEIHQETFNKIKDRYRIRLNLGRAHIEELVSERLIRHKPGADQEIGALYEDLKAFFPTFPVTRERFIRLYPVHPATSTLLDRLKPLFSEHRGVVDFIHFRLKGDRERHIPGMMDLPSFNLLTPERIFDHFIDRIRERAETQIYVERVFNSCREEISGLFKDPDQRSVALSAVKLLILFAISPVQYKYSVRHIAEMILFQVTSLESEINYQFVRDILDRLVKEGLYIRIENKEDPLEDHFYIDLKADMAGIIRRHIRHRASQLFPEDRRLFWKTASMVSSDYLPLNIWTEKGRQTVTLRWQQTQRSGTLLLRQLDELSDGEIEGLALQQERSEEDFFILTGTTLNNEAQYRHVKDFLLPMVRERHRGMFLFWVPAAVKEDITWLKELLAAALMEEKGEQVEGGEEKEDKNILIDFLKMGQKRLIDHYLHHYFNGRLLWDEHDVDLSRFGLLRQEKFFSEFVPPLLERRFPRHSRIQPHMGTLSPGILMDMLRDFLKNGALVVDDRSKFGIRDILDNLLKPMGLIKSRGNSYELHVNPKQNELARHFFKVMGNRESVPLEEMYWSLRKGEYGLLMPHLEILVLAMLFAGHLVAYKVLNRKSPEELARTGLKGVTALGRGEIISEELRAALPGHPLVPKELRNSPLTLASQEEIWTDLKSRKPSALEDLEALKSRIKWASSFDAFSNMPWTSVTRDIDDVSAQWEEVKVSLTSRDGLERFIRAGQKEPFLENKLKNIEDCQNFLIQAERALFVYQYISDQRLSIPDASYVRQESHPESGIRENSAPEGYERLCEDKAHILSFFTEKPDNISPQALESLFGRFRDFQDEYTKVYTEAHNRARGRSRFESYERLSRSKRFNILKRLDQLEMISVEHNYRSINQELSSVLLNQCDRSPHEHLQGGPVCPCGFRLGESHDLKPLIEIENEIEMCVRETMEAFHSPAVEEKIIPYIEGLELVNRKDEADVVRQFLNLNRNSEDFIDRLDQALTSGLIRDINEAFRGKVVVVRRDLDQLYRSLIHRKYTLAQLKRIFRDWLKEDSIGGDTFLHFVGTGEEDSMDNEKEDLRDFLDKKFHHLVSLYAEIGHYSFVKVMLASFWSTQYDLPTSHILEIYPFLERGTVGETSRVVEHLKELASMLHSENRRLFESISAESEQDESFIKALWSLLSSFLPEEIFVKEAVFPMILKEAFERLICGISERGFHEDVKGFHGVITPGNDSRLMERRREMIEALETCGAYRDRISALKGFKDTGTENFLKWESFYVRTISSIPYLRAKLRDGLKRLGTALPAFLQEMEKSAASMLLGTVAGFIDFYRKELPSWESEAERPLMIGDIPSILSKKRNVPDYRKICFILMDGMRWDLWEHIKTEFFGKRPDIFRFVREGSLWSALPTSTEPQLREFEKAFATAYPETDGCQFLKVSNMDEKIHSEKGSLIHLFANIVRFLELDVLYRLRDLPSRTLMVVFSDHGFTENPAFNPGSKYDSPRYTHGKDSPFEVIVPWAWIMRI